MSSRTHDDFDEFCADDEKHVSQDMLARFAELKALCRAKDALRDEIRERLLKGAVIEPGLYTAELKSRMIIPLTWKTIAEVVGQKRADQIKSRIARDERRALYVDTVAKLKRRTVKKRRAVKDVAAPRRRQPKPDDEPKEWLG